MMVPLVLLIIQNHHDQYFYQGTANGRHFHCGRTQPDRSRFRRLPRWVDSLREGVKKRLPSVYVSGIGTDSQTGDPLGPSWLELEKAIDSIMSSNASADIETGLLDAVGNAFASATDEYEHTRQIAEAGNADLDTLLERAIFIDRSLAGLNRTLDDLAVHVRKELQAAVDYEREIHNRPISGGDHYRDHRNTASGRFRMAGRDLCAQAGARSHGRCGPGV